MQELKKLQNNFKPINMTKKAKALIIIIILLFMFMLVQFNINLVLNKKYAVDEISYTHREEGLKGIQEIIENDYIYMLYFNVFYMLLLIGIIILIVTIKRKHI